MTLGVKRELYERIGVPAIMYGSEGHELRLWPIGMPHAKTRFRNLCRVELMNNIVFSGFLLEDNILTDGVDPLILKA